MRVYTLDEFSELTGLSKDTLRKYDKLLQPLRTPGGHRRYTDEHFRKLYGLGLIKNKEAIPLDTVIYARVSTKSQKQHLQRQVELLQDFCAKQGFKVDKVITDIGSAVNFQRKGLQELLRLLLANRFKRLVIFSRDRLARIGYDVFAELCRLTDTELIVFQDTDVGDTAKDIVDELIHVVHYHAMRLYGARSYKRIKKLEEEVLTYVDAE